MPSSSLCGASSLDFVLLGGPAATRLRILTVGLWQFRTGAQPWC
jgi:hypothetical protein